MVVTPLQLRIRFCCHSLSPTNSIPTIHHFSPNSFPLTSKSLVFLFIPSLILVVNIDFVLSVNRKYCITVRSKPSRITVCSASSQPQQMVEVKEIIVVCSPSYKDMVEDVKGTDQVELKFALPGKERQDSVYNGLQEYVAVDANSELVCIHDSAKLLVLSGDVKKVLKDGLLNGAAVLGVLVKATIKEANNESLVVRTLDRKTLWEMQTPQVIKPELLRRGFELVNREGLEVTDNVSLVEHLKQPVYVTEASYTNIKVTTPDDMLLAERILNIHSGETSL